MIKKFRRSVRVIVAAALTAGASPGRVASEPLGMEEEFFFAEIPPVITASKREESVMTAPSNITVVTEKQIKEWGVRNLKDVIKRTPGYYLVADRDERVFASRGLVTDNNSKFLVLIDGHRMSSVEHWGPGMIIEMPNDLSNVKQIEIIRGPGSAIWGADALAGVINIITKDPKDLGGHRVHASLSAGTQQSYTANFQAGRDDGDRGFILMGATHQSDGQEVRQWGSAGFPSYDSTFSFTDEFGASAHPLGIYRTRIDKHNPGAMLQLKGYSGDFSYNSFVSYGMLGNRHFEFGKGREVYLRGEKAFQQGKWRKRGDDGLDMTWRASWFYNRHEMLPLHGTGRNITMFDRGITSQFDASRPLARWLNADAGLDYQLTVLGTSHQLNSLNLDTPTTAGTGQLFDRHFTDETVGGYVMLHLLPSRDVKVSLGTRYDYNDDRGEDESVFNPRAAVVWQARPTTAFKALYNRGFKRPENNQSLSGVKSESIQQADLQWSQGVGRGLLTTTLYWQKLENFIAVISLSGNNRFANTGTFKATGAEVEFSLPVGEKSSAWANVSHTASVGGDVPAGLPLNNRRFKPDGTALSIPPLTANAGATLYLLDNLFVSPAVRHVEKVPYRVFPPVPATSLDNAVHAKTPAFTFIDLNVGFQPTKSVEISLFVDNLLDEDDPTHLSVWNGTIEQYGRYVEGTVSLKF